MFIYRKLRKIVKNIFTIKTVPVYIPKLQSNLLEGRCALITGGTSGIGYSIAEAFLASGATVVITGRSKERVISACSKLKSISSDYESKRVYGIEFDITNIQQINAIMDEVFKLFDDGTSTKRKIDILVNNAGMGSSRINQGAFSKISFTEFDLIMETNFKGHYFLSQWFAKYFINNKIAGNILNIASSSSLRPAVSAYTLSKWCIRGMTAGLAKTLLPYGIIVNGIAPGTTSTAMHVDRPGENLTAKNPIGRDACPEEIGNMAVIMVSSIARMSAGDILYMTGGSGTLTYDDMVYGF